ncbi:MAG: N-acetylglucosamine-6-phosphate deacetylase [Termitinemataceae bacterium]|nr:MAG: N-acetylglucosamine-6-phosphate deacetylase [Termitinemataceae bacterium]
MSICLYNGIVLTGFAVMENCAVLIEDGLISDVFSDKRLAKKQFLDDVQMIDVKGAYITPGFIDTHIHGFGGFGTEDNNGEESVLEMSRRLVECGVTAFNPTVYPCEDMVSVVKRLSGAVGKETGARIMGLHLEGPFLSPSKLGVQKPSTLKQVDLSYMEDLLTASNGHIINMTVAPEIKYMRDLALYCIKKKIILQAGHTDAAYENMVEGMQAGILHSTHLFNAMSKMDHRNPNSVGAVLIHPEISCEIIADGFHVHPDLFKLLMRDKPADKIVLVTDALKPTKQKTGPYFANGEEVVFHDGVFHRKVDDIIAGSALTMIQGVQNLVHFGFSLEDAVRAATANPARIMRYEGMGNIIPGYNADLTIFDTNFKIKSTIIGGDIKFMEDL